MTKSKIKKLHKEKINELKGFEELIDFDIQEDNKPKTAKRQIKDDEEYEMYNYLDSERVRLNLVSEVLTNKLENIKNYSQTQYLYAQQKHRRDQIKKKIVESHLSENSIFFKNLEVFFNKIFKK